MSEFPSDIEIARAATPEPIEAIAAKLGIKDELIPYGRSKAKVDCALFDRLQVGAGAPEHGFGNGEALLLRPHQRVGGVDRDVRPRALAAAPEAEPAV